MITTLAVVGDGLAGLRRSLRLVWILWFLVLLAAVPLGLVMEQAIRTDIGTSLVARDLLTGFDLGWLEEFQARSGSLAELLTPGRLSRVMPLESLELWLSGEWLIGNRQLAGTALLFLLFWILLQGGVIVHLARRGGALEARHLFGNGAVFFFRFVRIAALTGLGYFALYRAARWLFPAIDRWTRDVTVERTVLLWHLLAVLVFALLMSLVHLVGEYAKIATVQQERHSMVLAILHASAAIARHPLQAFGNLWIFWLLLLLLQAVYILVAPGVEGAGLGILILGLLIGQAYVWLRWALRIARFAAEITLYNRWSTR